MSADKKTFLKCVTVLYDTREQQNKHILDKLSELGIMTEQRKLDYGDYSFTAGGKDFSLSCVIERKANVDEIYGNIMADFKDRENGKQGRFEKELQTASQLAKGFTVLLEGVSSWEDLKHCQVEKWQMDMSPQRKNRETGAMVYSTLKSWSSASRFGFGVEFVWDRKDTAAKMLEVFYYYWRNYKELTQARR